MRSYSYSGLARLQQCERSYALHYYERLRRPEIQPWALMRGSAWHAVMAAEAIRLGHEQRSLLLYPAELKIVDGLTLPVGTFAAFSNIDAEDICTELQAWEVKQGGQFMDEMREEYGDNLSARIWNLWRRFCSGSSLEKLFGIPLLVEAEWERQLPNGLDLRGVTDLVFKDVATEQVVVRDWKLHESWPTTPPSIEDLVNSQLHLNAWGVAPLLREHSGEVPEAVEYARARFKKPATPTLTKAGKLAKSTTDYDAYTYAEFCASDEAVAAGYQMDEEYYTQLTDQRDRWFRLQRKPLLYNVYSQHVVSAASQAARAETITTENSVASYGSHCARCEFHKLCRADLIGGRQDYADIDPQAYDLMRKPDPVV